MEKTTPGARETASKLMSVKDQGLKEWQTEGLSSQFFYDMYRLRPAHPKPGHVNRKRIKVHRHLLLKKKQTTNHLKWVLKSLCEYLNKSKMNMTPQFHRELVKYPTYMKYKLPVY